MFIENPGDDAPSVRRAMSTLWKHLLGFSMNIALLTEGHALLTEGRPVSALSIDIPLLTEGG
jgi:hypothetical protein